MNNHWMKKKRCRELTDLVSYFLKSHDTSETSKYWSALQAGLDDGKDYVLVWCCDVKNNFKHFEIRLASDFKFGA